MTLASSSRPSIQGKVVARIPATLQGSGGLKVEKVNGRWTFAPDWSGLELITSLPDPSSKELWVKDPVTEVFYRMSAQVLIDNLPIGPAGDDGALIFVQNAAPSTSNPAGSIWVDADSTDLDLYQLVSSVWTDTGANLKGLTGPAAWSAPVAWLTATAYTVGPPASVVTQGGETYVCLIPHTSGVFATDLAASRWIKVAAKGADGAGTGDMVGPGSATDNAVVRFDTTTGKLVQNSVVTIADTTGVMTGAVFPNTGLKVQDTNASHNLTIAPGSDITASRTLTLTTGDADRTVTISGNATLVAGTVAVLAGAQTLTGGFKATPFSAGTKSSGTYTPLYSDGNFQTATNGGAHTLAPPADDCTIIVQYTNNGSAGAVTTSGFTRKTGDAFTTVNGDDFFCTITKCNGFSHVHVLALQ